MYLDSCQPRLAFSVTARVLSRAVSPRFIPGKDSHPPQPVPRARHTIFCFKSSRSLDKHESLGNHTTSNLPRIEPIRSPSCVPYSSCGSLLPRLCKHFATDFSSQFHERHMRRQDLRLALNPAKDNLAGRTRKFKFKRFVQVPTTRCTLSSLYQFALTTISSAPMSYLSPTQSGAETTLAAAEYLHAAARSPIFSAGNFGLALDDPASGLH